MVKVLRETKGIKFCGSSILIAYCLETGKAEAKIIDFQNIESIGGIDDEIIFGLENLIKELQALIIEWREFLKQTSITWTTKQFSFYLIT